jgi:dihydrofolate reductase
MNFPKISLIAAISENRVLANNGKIPWKIPADVKRYRDKIKGHVSIAGRKTFDTSYTETVNIVITRDLNYNPPLQALVVHSVTEALEKAKSRDVLEKAHYQDEIFVIGGGEIFHETLPFADKLYLTIIHQVIDGNTFFPDYSEFKKIVFSENNEENGYKFTFLDLER